METKVFHSYRKNTDATTASNTAVTNASRNHIKWTPKQKSTANYCFLLKSKASQNLTGAGPSTRPLRSNSLSSLAR
ncbi:uncharacterized protein PHALS_15178 [Plasmopara halstedii]|uniref:Uncharacterized protein n=1 Tax=Plasmopara halstedii TaxID=4781 RepID=A0A0P1B3N9_PLAHL|nr:uncharacterized protein PHALS_15178 [Plasmopara halstedii]CEG48850.1 hypothetical protein PHALS_15178 [Plasmopara halstedii]|eukprot:XP_024585219.1 hypothetical protein PHALS_15178 [Plasmopara halstedii]